MPHALNQIVLKAVAKDAEQRYQSAEAFASDLRSARAGGPLVAAAYDPRVERTQLMSRPPEAVALAGAEPLEEQGAGRRQRRGPWPLAALIIVLLLVIAGAAYGLYGVIGGNGGAVPSVVGQTEEAAVAALEDAGFVAKVSGEEYSDEYEAGTVLRQAPEAGTELREGGTVELWVCRGPATIPLADFKGWTAQEVRDWLEENGLQGVKKSGRSEDVEEGQVYRQRPAAGVDVARGESVTYWVSGGVPRAAVPDLGGMTRSEAESALGEENLKLGNVSSQPSDSVPAGRVISQDPAAGTKVEQESTVNVVLSTGTPTPSPSPDMAVVPSVYTMNVATATATLVDAGFRVVVRAVTSTAEPGTVVGMSPEGESSAPVGSRVTIDVAEEE